jgi:tungstate transport system substrate-binding protein
VLPVEKLSVLLQLHLQKTQGLLKFVLPRFEKKHGIKIRTIVQGTGQALETGRRGDVDILMVHAPPLEKKVYS